MPVPLVCINEIADGLPCHLLEEPHQMRRLGEIQAPGNLLDALIGEKQGLFDFLQEPLLKQVARTHAELIHHSLIEGHTAQMHHLGVVLYPDGLANILLNQRFVLVGVVVERWGEREREPMCVEAVELEQKFVQIRKDHPIAVRNRVAQLSFHVLQESGQRDEFFRRLRKYWITDYKSSQVMRDLRSVVAGEPYFVLTSNGDTHLELSGFDPERVFEIEGTFANAFGAVDDKSDRLQDFVNRYSDKRLVIMELGIGRRNTLTKRPLMQITAQLPTSAYITLNLEQELYIPDEIADRSIGLAGDIAETLHALIDNSATAFETPRRDDERIQKLEDAYVRKIGD